MVKSAEDEALEANNALSVAKMEAERLRQLLGTMDTTKASDEAAVKVIQPERGTIRRPTTSAPYFENILKKVLN